MLELGGIPVIPFIHGIEPIPVLNPYRYDGMMIICNTGYCLVY